MKTILVALGSLAFIIVMGAVSIILGGVGGWLSGIFFEGWILGTLEQFGVTGVTMFELGAFLGFVGSYFKAYTFSTGD